MGEDEHWEARKGGKSVAVVDGEAPGKRSDRNKISIDSQLMIAKTHDSEVEFV